MTRLATLALLLPLASCEAASELPTVAEDLAQDTAQDTAQSPPQVEAPPEVDVGKQDKRWASDCDELADYAQRDPIDLALLPRLCPAQARALPPRLRRASLRAQPDPRRAAQLDGELQLDAELGAVAQLWRRTPMAPAEPTPVPTPPETVEGADPDTPPPPPPPAPPALPSPVDASFVPLTAETLAHIDLAQSRLITGGLSGGQRLNARAFVARAFMESIAAIGLDPAAALDPIALPLAGPALHHTRLFLESFWRSPRRKLRGRAESMELAMLDLSLALAHSPPHALTPLTNDAQHRAWLYLQRSEVSARLAKQLARIGRSREGYTQDDRPRPGHESLEAPSAHFHRLAAAGLEDTLVQSAFVLASRAKGPGATPVEQDALRVLELYLRGERLDRARGLLTKSFDPIRSRGLGPQDYRVVDKPSWPQGEQIVEALLDDLADLHNYARGSFERRHSLGRLALRMEQSPGLVPMLLADPRCPEAVRSLYDSEAQVGRSDAEQGDRAHRRGFSVGASESPTP